MSHSPAKVTIDLQEYQELIEKSDLISVNPLIRVLKSVAELIVNKKDFIDVSQHSLMYEIGQLAEKEGINIRMTADNIGHYRASLENIRKQNG